jgi:RHS repeat-associated protein
MRLYETVGASTTRFAYDGVDLVAEHNGSNTLLRRFVHGPGVDDPIVWYEGSGTSDRRFLQTDERGSVTTVTNSSGGVIATNSYDEYGIPASTNLGRFQYTGQTWLPELGMYYYKARIYSPTLGRFLQPDPIEYGDGLNIYGYVGNDPINWLDPSGTKQVCVEQPGTRIRICVKVTDKDDDGDEDRRDEKIIEAVLLYGLANSDLLAPNADVEAVYHVSQNNHLVEYHIPKLTWWHITLEHFRSSVTRKSQFDSYDRIHGLIVMTIVGSKGIHQPNGRVLFERNFGQSIGTDRSGLRTSWVTVITTHLVRGRGSIVTAFPGKAKGR